MTKLNFTSLHSDSIRPSIMLLSIGLASLMLEPSLLARTVSFALYSELSNISVPKQYTNIRIEFQYVIFLP